MLILFLRSIFLYCLIFAVIRLTGKRQLSDIQPFDLVVTLLIADLAAEPASDTAVPLVYAVVPILALFLMQRMIYLQRIPGIFEMPWFEQIIIILKRVFMKKLKTGFR